MPSTPTRYPSGVSVQARPYFYSNYPTPTQIVLSHEYANDFDTYVATDWTVTTTTGSNALTAGNGGILTLTTAAAANDIQGIQKTPAAFAFVLGEPLWFSVNVNANDTASSIFAGLMTGGTVIAPTDGVFFSKATGQNNVSITVKTGGASTVFANVTSVNPSPTIATTLGFYYDGLGNPTLWVFSSQSNYNSASAFGAPVPIGGNMCGAFGAQATSGFLLTNLPLSNLAPTVAIEAGAAAVKTLAVDYLFAANQILRV
jgi:hypothetical protein